MSSQITQSEVTAPIVQTFNVGNGAERQLVFKGYGIPRINLKALRGEYNRGHNG